MTGSSPLSRGIRRIPAAGRARRRIIPALAGNTSKSRPAKMSRTGSSPLSRGIPQESSPGAPERRIIPALAGNTANYKLPTVLAADHPRSRGEYGAAKMSELSEFGSSPLSRGILLATCKDHTTPRIIPALAGNTGIVYWTQPVRADHPRSRGEYTALAARRQQKAGSSPLSRGIRCHGVWSRSRDRIIPALAGNTPTGTPAAPLTRDHPRSRGEYVGQGMLSGGPFGSSPLSRGIRERR